MNKIKKTGIIPMGFLGLSISYVLMVKSNEIFGTFGIISGFIILYLSIIIIVEGIFRKNE